MKIANILLIWLADYKLKKNVRETPGGSSVSVRTVGAVIGDQLGGDTGPVGDI